MITVIQQNLQQIIHLGTDFPIENIYTDNLELDNYSTPPWISIIPKIASIQSAWHKENFYQTSDALSLITRKYNVTQPFTLHLEFMDKHELSQIIDQIFVALPKKILLPSSIVEIEPKSVELSQKLGILSPYNAKIIIDTHYAIHENITISNKIHDVNLNIKYI